MCVSVCPLVLGAARGRGGHGMSRGVPLPAQTPGFLVDGGPTLRGCNRVPRDQVLLMSPTGVGWEGRRGGASSHHSHPGSSPSCSLPSLLHLPLHPSSGPPSVHPSPQALPALPHPSFHPSFHLSFPSFHPFFSPFWGAQGDPVQLSVPMPSSGGSQFAGTHLDWSKPLPFPTPSGSQLWAGSLPRCC